MRIAILEDEAPQARLTEGLLQEWAQERREGLSVRVFPCADAFLFAWEDDRTWDLLILDIMLEAGLNGMELARRLRDKGAHVPLLFVTGFDEYMPEGYDVGALHYLIKPVEKEKLFRVLDRLLSERAKEEPLILKTQEGTVALLPSRIRYVEATGHHLEVHAEEGVHVLSLPLSEMEEKLRESGDGVRCHRGIVVSLRHVCEVNRSVLTLDDGTTLPVSRRELGKVMHAFATYYGREGEG